HPYRAHSGFSHLTGWGSEAVPGSVLVIEPSAGGHEATLYFRPTAGRGSEEFYANAAIGEFWTGPRPSLAHVSASLGIATRDLAELDGVIDGDEASALVVRDADPGLTEQLDGRRLLSAEDDAEPDTAPDAVLA